VTDRLWQFYQQEIKSTETVVRRNSSC